MDDQQRDEEETGGGGALVHQKDAESSMDGQKDKRGGVANGWSQKGTDDAKDGWATKKHTTRAASDGFCHIQGQSIRLREPSTLRESFFIHEPISLKL